jgi:hypothetical protein
MSIMNEQFVPNATALAGIYRLSDMTAEEKATLDNRIAENPLYSVKPAEKFDTWGLRYSTEHLNEIGAGIIFMPLEYMAEYVDERTKKGVDSSSASFRSMALSTSAPEKKNIKKINATSLGNLAYTCLHADDRLAIHAMGTLMIIRSLIIEVYEEETGVKILGTAGTA